MMRKVSAAISLLYGRRLLFLVCFVGDAIVRVVRRRLLR